METAAEATENMEMMEMGEEDPETTTEDGTNGEEKKASGEGGGRGYE